MRKVLFFVAIVLCSIVVVNNAFHSRRFAALASFLFTNYYDKIYDGKIDITKEKKYIVPLEYEYDSVYSLYLDIENNIAIAKDGLISVEIWCDDVLVHKQNISQFNGFILGDGYKSYSVLSFHLPAYSYCERQWMQIEIIEPYTLSDESKSLFRFFIKPSYSWKHT